MSKITFTEEGWSDYLYWQLHDKKIVQKINRLLKSIARDAKNSGFLFTKCAACTTI